MECTLATGRVSPVHNVAKGEHTLQIIANKLTGCHLRELNSAKDLLYDKVFMALIPQPQGPP
jgi:hypothetical protein